MGRPKRTRKPSKRALARRSKKELRRKGNFISLSSGPLYDDFVPVISGATGVYDVTWAPENAGTAGGVTITGGTGVVVNTVSSSGAVTVTGGTGLSLAATRTRIESLDEGLTWHVANTLEPVVNRNGQLLIGTQECGPAPETMRPGSGVYDFEIESRWTTPDEARGWWEHHQAMSNARDAAQAAGQPTDGFVSAWGEYRHTSDPALEAADQATRLEEFNRRLQDEAERRERARVRARQLLESHLSASQRHDLEERDGFWVRSQHGNRYWVTLSTAVRFDDRGVALQRYCIHATDPSIPAADNALLRMLLLKCDEDAFLRTANPAPPSEWDIRRTRRVVAIPDVVAMPVARPATNTEIVAATGGNGGRLTITGGWTNVISPGYPVVRFINGVYRPLCG